MKEGYKLLEIPLSVQRKVFVFLSCAVALSVPFKASYNSILLITLIVFWLGFMDKKFDARRIRFIMMISSLFWIALAGMIYTQNSNEGLFRLQQKALLLVVPLVFGTIDFDWQDELRAIVTFLMLAVAIACLFCLMDGFIFWMNTNSVERFFSHGLVERINMYPYILSLLCLMGVLVFIEVAQGKLVLHHWFTNRMVAILFLIFFSVFIFLLSVKQIILAWIIVLIISSVRLYTRRRVMLIMLSGCLLLTIVSVVTIPTLRDKIDEMFNGKENTIPLDQDASLGKLWNGIALRKAIWICTFDAIRNNPLLGVGTGDGQDILQEAYEARQFYFASRHNLYNTHNQYLQTLVNFGVVGLVIWLYSLYWLLSNFRSNGLLVSLIGCLMFAMLTESMFETNKGVLLMAFGVTIFSFAQPPRATSHHHDNAGN